MTQQTKPTFPKIYRTVPIKDEDGVKGRLPEKEGYYTVFDSYNGTHVSFCEAFMNGEFKYHHITHWLEEVELPSSNLVTHKSESKYTNLLCQDRFFHGAKWMLNLILGK